MAFNYYTQLPQNWYGWLWTSVGQQQFVMSLCTLNTLAAPFSICLAPLQLRLTYRTQQCNRTCVRQSTFASLDDTIIAVKISRVEKWPDWGPTYSVANFSCFRELQCTGNRWHVYCELSFKSQYRFAALVQRIANCSKIKNTHLTLDKVLNVWIYGLLRCDQIHNVEERLKWS